MVEVSTFSNQLLHFRDISKAKIILWEESGAFDTWKLALIRAARKHTHIHIKEMAPRLHGLAW